LKGLTSKEHLFLRVLSVVFLIDGVGFFILSRHPEYLSSPWEFARFAVLLTALTLFVLSVNLEFWWRYLRRTDNQRFWVWDLSAILERVQPAKADEAGGGRIVKGLTSKERLFLRILSTVLFINAAVFYAVSRHMQTFVANFFEVIALTTGLTLFVLTIQLLFWWKYLRTSDDQRFWGLPRKTENPN
jgi:hypothetical protein